MNIKKRFAQLLLILNILQLLTPHATLHAAISTPENKESTWSCLHLPSRKAFTELSQCWQGLPPAAYMQDTSSMGSGGNSADQVLKFVGAQQATLNETRKTQPLAEALSFFNNLAAPGRAIEDLNCTKRLMTDMQMFGGNGLHKAFNRTILALGQTLQLAQFYQGADSAKTAEERRDFITAILKQPEIARALTLRIKNFAQYENQFLRQYNAPRNKFLEAKIKALEPPRVFGILKNHPKFLRIHTLITQKIAHWPFIGYESIKASYIFSTLWTAIFLWGRGFSKTLANTSTQENPLLANMSKLSQLIGVQPTSDTQESKQTFSLKHAARKAAKEITSETLHTALELKTSEFALLKFWFQVISLAGLKNECSSLNAKQLRKIAFDLTAGPFLAFLPFKGNLPSERLEQYKSLTEAPDFLVAKFCRWIHDNPKEFKALIHSDPTGSNLVSTFFTNTIHAADPAGLHERHDLTIDTMNAVTAIRANSTIQPIVNPILNTNVTWLNMQLNLFPNIKQLINNVWTLVPNVFQRKVFPTYVMFWLNVTNPVLKPIAETLGILTGNISHVLNKAIRPIKAAMSLSDIFTNKLPPVRLMSYADTDNSTLTIEMPLRMANIGEAALEGLQRKIPTQELFYIKRTTTTDTRGTYLNKEASHAAAERIISGSAKKKLQTIAKHKENISEACIGAETLTALTCICAGTIWALKVRGAGEKAFLIKALDEHMFSSLKPAIALAEMTRQISQIFNTNKNTLPLPQSLQEKLFFLITSASEECKMFSALAQNPLFAKPKMPGIFGDFGVIRQAYKLADVPSVKQWLSVCAAFIAEVDSYVGIARLTAEHKDNPNYFSPVTFIEQDRPKIELLGFWFPIISSFTGISNNITIGDPAHILLTGINGGGKSIALKGMIFAILMAHAFAYAPLATGTMTFMSKIITHLSSTDNAAEGDSCWIAEAKSMGKALHEMQTPHTSGERILYVGDELGSGTADHAAIAAVAQFMEVALKSSHVASIISTHLRPLTQLEEISKGMVLNYRVGGTVNSEGTIQRKYRLERGIADINIAELIVNQLIEHGEQKTAAHPENTPSAAIVT